MTPPAASKLGRGLLQRHLVGVPQHHRGGALADGVGGEELSQAHGSTGDQDVHPSDRLHGGPLGTDPTTDVANTVLPHDALRAVGYMRLDEIDPFCTERAPREDHRLRPVALLEPVARPTAESSWRQRK